MRQIALLLLVLAGCASSELPDDPQSIGHAPKDELVAQVGGGDTPTPQPNPDPEPQPQPPPPQPPPPPAPSPPPAKLVLNASWQGQQTGYWCGPGSTRIALSTRMATPPSQQTLANYLPTTTDGTDHVGLVRNALNHYLGTTWFEVKEMYDPPTQAQRDLLKKDLLVNIQNGYPIVANVVSGWRPPGYPGGTIYHYVAVIGYDNNGDRVLIADPAAEGAAGSSWTNVPRTYWISIWDLGTWIGGKGYTA